MDYRKILSYISSILVFLATAFIIIKIIMLDTTGPGITNSEFIPIRNAMFTIGVPCFLKFYISSDKNYKENKKWMIGYIISTICWTAFLLYALINPYFTNIRTMYIASFVLMAVATYLQYSMTERNK